MLRGRPPPLGESAGEGGGGADVAVPGLRSRGMRRVCVRCRVRPAEIISRDLTMPRTDACVVALSYGGFAHGIRGRLGRVYRFWEREHSGCHPDASWVRVRYVSRDSVEQGLRFVDASARRRECDNTRFMFRMQ